MCWWQYAVDLSSHLGYRECKEVGMKDFHLEKRRLVLSGIAVGIIVIYLVRLFTLQIMSDDYRKSADSNAFLKKIEFPAAWKHY